MVRGWVRRRAAGAAMAAAIAVAVALAATAAAMRRGCLSGSDSGNGRRRREGGQASLRAFTPPVGPTTRSRVLLVVLIGLVIATPALPLAA